MSVFARPGTPSSRQWPLVKIAAKSCSITSSCPTIILLSSLRIWSRCSRNSRNKSPMLLAGFPDGAFDTFLQYFWCEVSFKRAMQLARTGSYCHAAKQSKQVSVEEELLLQTLRGMRDILPDEQPYWERVRRILTSASHEYGFSRIDLPTVEFAHLSRRAPVRPRSARQGC